ncbi:toll/interleukin-1 receptor domain-containing protein [Phytohabitans kaempferiae]|uniref:Toll/interleukin-1 receptor domain-containing protein n=1 Tax=Phytohabitans kaempferiae TaxID=1620943 RepID=A0ABV6MFA2_9ACTN
MTDIFVNYRSSDEPLAALIIDQALTARLDAGRVFRDTRSIELGAHFPPEIRQALQACRVLLAIIGTGWLAEDRHGARRIDDPQDFVRMEIAEALRRDIRVVPVLVGGAVLPRASELPADVAGLVTRQYLELRTRYAAHDVRRLVEELLRIVGAPPPAGSAGAVPTQVVVTNMHGPVDARRSVFGINNAR